MKVLDLFSGIGGFSLGLERAGMETIAFCEFDEHAQKVLRKHWPDVPIHSDVRSLNGHDYRGTVDIVCGGFPCQDLSTAGKRIGFDGERSSLYGEMLRIISECMPRYAIFENVSGLLTGDSGRWFAKFLYDLDSIGFDAEWHCIEAAYIGAPHRRDRVWIIAYPKVLLCNDGNIDKKDGNSQAQEFRSGDCKANVAYTASQRQSGQGKSKQSISAKKNKDRQASIFKSVRIKREWATEPSVGRVAHGVPNRSHRLKQLGNAVVPQIPEAIGRAIMEAAA